MTTSPRTNTMSKLRVTVWETPARMSTEKAQADRASNDPAYFAVLLVRFLIHLRHNMTLRGVRQHQVHVVVIGLHATSALVIRHPIGSTSLVSRTCSFPRISRFPRHFTKMVSSILSLMRSSGSFTLDSSAAMVPTMPGASVLRSGALRTASRTAEFLLFAKF